MNQVKPIHADHAQSKAYRFNTDIVAPPKVQKRKIEMVPGLGLVMRPMTSQMFTCSLSLPGLRKLHQGSKAVINPKITNKP